MNETLQKRPFGISANGIRTWGILCLTIGIAGKSLIENRMLGISSLTGQQLIDMMEKDPGVMTAVSIALLCQALYTCAAPLFAFLLVEGFRNTGDFKKYILRVGILALVTEIPYDLAFTGKFFSFSGQNPVFALLLCLVVLWFYNRYSGKSGKNLGIKILVTVAALMWLNMLRVEDGPSIFILVAVLWGFRNQPGYRILAAVAAGFACSIFSPFYMVCPMALIAVHFYNGEKGNENRIVNYALYPLLLILFYGVGILLF